MTLKQSIREKRPIIWPFKAFILCLLILGSAHLAHASVQVTPSSFDSDGNIGTLTFTGTPSVTAFWAISAPLQTTVSSSGASGNAADGTFTALSNINLQSFIPSFATTTGNYYIWYFDDDSVAFNHCAFDTSKCLAESVQYAVFSFSSTTNTWTADTCKSAVTQICTLVPYDDEEVGVDGLFLLSDANPWRYQAAGYILPQDGKNLDTGNPQNIQLRFTISAVESSTAPCTAYVCAQRNADGSLTATNTGEGILTFYSGRSSFLGAQSFTFSTTTNYTLKPDYYQMQVEIIKPVTLFGSSDFFGIADIFNYSTIARKTINFKVGTTSAYQDFLEELAKTKKLTGDYHATTTNAIAQSCNPANFTVFAIDDCLTYLFKPDPQKLKETFMFFRDNIANRFPWGYGTRVVEILTNTASSTASTDLPTFTAAFTPDSPMHGEDITINLQEMLEKGSSTLAAVAVDPVSGKTMKEIFEPWILLFIALSAIIIIFHDIMGMGKHTQHANN